MSDWRPVARDRYDPLKAGSIDGTDTEPHDRAVWRAMNAHYVPPEVDTKPSHTLFVGRVPHNVDEEQLHHKFSAFGVVEKICLIRDIVTGFSKGYCFVEYRKEKDAEYAMKESTGLLINGCPVLVDWEAGHRLKGWVPRRLGGGWGGRKEAGQLRFGCRDRPWKKPIVIHPPRLSQKPYGKDVGTSRSHDRQDRFGPREERQDRHGSSEGRQDRHGSREYKQDRHGLSEDRHGSREFKQDRHGLSEDRHGSSEDRHGSREFKQDRHGLSEDRHGSKEYRQDRHGLSEDRHGSSEDRQDWHGSREDRHRNDFRNKDKKWRREDRRDRHTYSSSSHKRTHKSAAT